MFYINFLQIFMMSPRLGPIDLNPYGPMRRDAISLTPIKLSATTYFTLDATFAKKFHPRTDPFPQKGEKRVQSIHKYSKIFIISDRGNHKLFNIPFRFSVKEAGQSDVGYSPTALPAFVNRYEPINYNYQRIYTDRVPSCRT